MTEGLTAAIIFPSTTASLQFRTITIRPLRRSSPASHKSRYLPFALQTVQNWPPPLKVDLSRQRSSSVGVKEEHIGSALVREHSRSRTPTWSCCWSLGFKRACELAEEVNIVDVSARGAQRDLHLAACACACRVPQVGHARQVKNSALHDEPV